MNRTRADRLFARYRRHGDPRLLAEVFDHTAPELWRVAAHLCRDRHDAEDAVQSTFLTAIESKQAWDEGRPLLPWLVGLLINRVRHQRRQRERVVEAGRVQVQQPTDPATAAGDREFGAAFAAALREVTEPFRSVLERHLVHGMNAGDIAAELGVPPPTVRTRLHRGLEQLRLRLPAGAEAGALVPLRLPGESLASMREAVLQDLPCGHAVATGGASCAVAVSGVLLMKKLLLGIAAACLAVGGWWALDAAKAQHAFEVADAANAMAKTEALAVAPSPIAAQEASADVPATTALTRTAAPTAGELSVLVRDATTHAPIAGIGVVAMLEQPPPRTAAIGSDPGAPASTSRDDPAPARADGKTDAEGQVVLRIAAGRVRVLANRGLPAPSSVVVPAGATTQHVHDVEPVFSADVLVQDSNGSPIADAMILGQDDRSSEIVELGRTGPDGHWREARTEFQLLVRAVRPGFAASSMGLTDGSTSTTMLQLGPRSATMHGVVMNEAGSALSNAIVVFAPLEANAQGRAPITTRTDERGRYRCDWLTPGTYDLLVSHARGPHDRCVRTFQGVAAPDEGAATDLRFTAGATVVVQLRRHDGHPLVNYPVQVARKPADIPTLFAPWFNLVGQTDAEGDCTLRSVMPGRYTLTATYYNASVEKELELHAGETVHFDHTFGELCSLQIEVVDEAGTPRPGIGVASSHRNNESRRGTTDVEGRVRFDQLERRDSEVSLFPNEKGLAQSRHTVSPGGVVRLVLPTNAARGTVVGRVIAPGGTLPEGLSLTLYSDVASNPFQPDTVHLTLDTNNGQFRCDDLPADRYYFAVMTAAPFRNLALRTNIEVSRERVTDLGVITLGSGDIHIEVRTEGGTGKVHAGVAALLGPDLYEPRPKPTTQHDQIDLQCLAAGSYRVLVWGEAILPSIVDATVAIDSVTSLTIDAKPGVRTEVHLPGSVGTMHVHMPDGSVLREMVLELKSWVRGLTPGSYRVDYVTFGGDRHCAEFSVGASDGPPIDLRRQ